MNFTQIRKPYFSADFRAKFAFSGMTALGLGLASCNYFPNTFLISKFQEIVQLYRYGNPEPVPRELVQQFETVLSDLEIKPQKQALIRPFTVYGFDMFHAGSTYTRNGAIIGIPSTFHYKDEDDVNTEVITIENKGVDWFSEEGKNFKKSLVYSENAKAYLLAHEISMVDTYLVFLRAVYPLSITISMYAAAQYMNQKLKLLQGRFMVRGIMYGIVGLFGLGSWAFLQDFTTVTYESRADRKICALGKKYIEGGLEAHSKLLQRNISLRQLLGASGPRTYTNSGNEVFFIRTKRRPLTSRKEFFEKQLNELESENRNNKQTLSKAANIM